MERLPDLRGDAGDQADFIPLLGFGQRVTLFGGSKTALRAEANLRQRDVLRRLLQSSLHPFRVFQLPVLVVIRPSTTC